MSNLFSLNILFDSFESAYILYYYFQISEVFTLIITSGLIYMFVHSFILFFFRISLIQVNHIVNIVTPLMKSFIATLYDIVINYLFYK